MIEMVHQVGMCCKGPIVGEVVASCSDVLLYCFGMDGGTSNGVTCMMEIIAGKEVGLRLDGLEL